MRVIANLAYITCLEGLRAKSLIGIWIFSLCMLFVNIIISGMILQDVGKVSVDIGMFAYSMSGFVVVLFVGLNLISKDLDKKTIYAVLSRSVSRSQYIIGKFFGVALVLAVSCAILALVSIVSVYISMYLYQNYFTDFKLTVYVLALILGFVKLLLLLSVVFLFSSFTSNSFVTLVLSIITYLSGQMLHTAKVLVDNPGSSGLEFPEFLKVLLDILYYVVPNFRFLDYTLQASHGISVSMVDAGFSIAYGFVYSVILIFVSTFVFGRREFP